MTALNLFIVFDNRCNRTRTSCGADADMFMAARKSFLRQSMQLLSLAKISHSSLFSVNVHLSVLYKNHYEVLLRETLLSNHNINCTNDLTIMRAFKELEQLPPTMINEVEPLNELQREQRSKHNSTHNTNYNHMRVFYALLNSLTEKFAQIHRERHIEHSQNNEMSSSTCMLCIGSYYLTHSTLYNSFIRLCSCAIPFVLRGVVIDVDAMCVTSASIADRGKLWRCSVNDQDIREAVQAALCCFLNLSYAIPIAQSPNSVLHPAERANNIANNKCSDINQHYNHTSKYICTDMTNSADVYTTLHIGEYTCKVKAQRPFLSYLRCCCDAKDFDSEKGNEEKLYLVGSELRYLSAEHAELPEVEKCSQKEIMESNMENGENNTNATGLVLTRVLNPWCFDETYLWGENWLIDEYTESVNSINLNSSNQENRWIHLYELHHIFANDVMLFRNYETALCRGEHRFILTPSYCVAYFVINSDNNNNNKSLKGGEYTLLLRHIIPPELRRIRESNNAPTSVHHTNRVNTSVNTNEAVHNYLTHYREKLHLTSSADDLASLDSLMESNLCEFVSRVCYEPKLKLRIS